MSSSRLYDWTTFIIRRPLVSSAVIVLEHGLKCVIFVSRYFTTKTKVKPFASGMFFIKLVRSEALGCCKPYGQGQGVLECVHVSRDIASSRTNFYCCGHK